MTGLLTAREVADMLGVNPETALRWARRGEFASVVVYLPGGAVRYREDRLVEWLERRATPPTRHPAVESRSPTIAFSEES